MRGIKVKKLRKEFEGSIEHLQGKDRLKTSPVYKSKWYVGSKRAQKRTFKQYSE